MNTNMQVDVTPLVSILIPCYNHEKFVVDCISSVLNQDYDNIEILICDDCSTDQSWYLINSMRDVLEKRAKRVVLLKNDENRGITKSLNRLLQEARGEFVKPLASDDALVKRCISMYMQQFKIYPESDIFVSDGYIINEECRYPFGKQIEKFYKDKPDLSGDDLFIRLYCDNIIFAPGVILRMNVYKEWGLYDESIGIEDWEYWLRVSKKNRVRFKYINECLVYYRKNNNSMTSIAVDPLLETRRKRLYEAGIRIIDKFGSDVPTHIYATNKLRLITSERELAREYLLKEMKQLTTAELKTFNMWKYISFRRKAKLLLHECKRRLIK